MKQWMIHNIEDKKKIRTLIVEDHYIINAAVKDLLESVGCEADIAENGAKSIALYEQNEYDLIFMDLGLPDMDGYEVTRTIRDIERGQHHTPIIGLSAQTDQVIVKKAIDAGMDDYISKPLTEEQCIEKLQKYITHYIYKN